MTPPLTELRDTLVRLHGSGLAVGLPADRAERLVAALGRGASITEAASVSGLDPRLAGIVSRAGVDDVPAVLGRLAVACAEVDTHTRRMRGAGVYPLLLACSISLASALVFGLMVSSLSQVLAPISEVSLDPMMAGIGLAVGLLFGLAGVVFGRVPLPTLSSGWAALDAYAFVEGLQILTGAGVALPVGLRAAGLWCGRRGQAAAEKMARALEAGGGEVDASPLLAPFESAVLMGAAVSGTQVETTTAMADQHRVALSRRLASAVVRIETVGLLIAGLALLGLAVSYILVYVDVIAR